MSGPGGAERSGAGAELRCAVRGGPARGSAPSQLRCPALLERPRCGAATAAGTAGVTQLFAVPAGGGGGRGRRVPLLLRPGDGSCAALPRAPGGAAGRGREALCTVTGVVNPAAPRLGRSASIRAAAHRGLCRAVPDAGPVPAPRRLSSGGWTGLLTRGDVLESADEKGIL